MPNYNKSFNFRSGVQVDYDNFIVNSNGLVGIGTSVAENYLFNVYGDSRVTGLTTTKNLQVSDVATVGFLTASQGIHVSSAVTATAFYGDGSTLSNIVGFSVTSWILNIAQTGLSTTLNIGIGTQALDAYDLVIGDDPLVSEGISFVGSTGNVYSSGIITATSFSGSGAGLTALSAPQLTGVIDNARLPSSINVSGIITATLGFDGNVTGNLTGTASTAHSITNTANITVNSINSGFSTTGISTVFTKLDVGTGGTAFAALNSGRIGIGTALPTSELQIRKASGSLLEVISNSGNARISIGQSVGVGNSTAVIRFGDTDGTLDIINNDIGNINYYLHAGDPGIGTGGFNWVYGQTIEELMTLTYDGNLGLGETNPDHKMHVVGTSTVTGNAYFGSDVSINGNLSVGSFSLPSIIVGTNIFNSSGVSTFYNLNVTNKLDATTGQTIVLLNSVGIGTTLPRSDIDAENSLMIIGSIGIGTTALYTDLDSDNTPALQLFNKDILINAGNLILNPENEEFSAVGFNTFTPRSIFDFGNVGSASTVAGYFIAPSISTVDRDKNSNFTGIGNTVEGAIIYNTTLKRHQGYGSIDGGSTFGWYNLY